MSGFNCISVSENESVFEITIRRPEVSNALNAATHAELHEAFDRFANDRRLRVATITGEGRAFCAGSDLKERDRNGITDMPPSGYAGFLNRFDLDKPVIAAVNGHAIGGGMEIVLACDLAVAARGAKFGLPEPRVGLAAEGGLYRLSRQLPAKTANRIALLGELFDADEALECGLVNEVVEPHRLRDAVERMTKSLLANAPLALAATKQMLRRGADSTSLEAAHSGKPPGLEAMLASDDALEGVRAFVEKRPPRWTGQ